MGGGHAAGSGGGRTGDALYLPGDSRVHQWTASTKVVAVLGFVLVVALTPPARVWAFAGYAGLIVLAAGAAGISWRVMLPRMLVEVPFVLFALMMPVLGRDPRIELLGLELSEPGLWAAWSILAKGTLGVAAAVLLAATTPSRELLAGLRHLRVPATLVEIAGFMVRYAQVVTDQWHRMTQARAARGFAPRGPRSWPVLGRSAGALFIRSYERGERVHLAMRARGYTGTMPPLTDPDRVAVQPQAALLPLAAAGVLVAAVLGG